MKNGYRSQTWDNIYEDDDREIKKERIEMSEEKKNQLKRIKEIANEIYNLNQEMISLMDSEDEIDQALYPYHIEINNSIDQIDIILAIVR